MNVRETSKALLPLFTGMMAVCFFGACIGYAQSTPVKKPAPAAKPAAAVPKAATPASKTPTTATHGPTTTTAGHGPTTTTAGHGPTTTTAGHPTATTAGRGPTTTTRGSGPTAAGRGPVTSAHGPAGGSRGVTASGHPAPNGHTTMHTANGGAITRRPDGRVAEVHDARRGMDVHHGMSGERRVSVERADHSRIVAERGGRGYVQRPYNYHGHEFAHRTYYEHGRAYDRFYRGYPYHGVYVEMYTPAYYYRPAFYGWAYNPWVTPVPYAWGFGVAPWYGYYGGYFTPYPVYPSASFWLADYMISQSLAADYQAQVDAQVQAQAMANAAPPTPDVKDLIAAEVQRQIALSNAEAQAAARNAELDPASSGIQRMLTDNVQHVFVAGRSLDLVDGGGTECSISEGDALQLAGPPPADATAANLIVLSNKGGVECRKGATVTVALADLQDMQNHMRETIDAGMGELQSKQGQGGLPALPPSANAPPTKVAFAAEAPPPDPTASTQITQQMQEADKAETEVVAQAMPQPPSPNQEAPAAAPPTMESPKTISLGQTFDEVTAILGSPKSIMDAGPKKIYLYKDMKITFKDGKVTDIE